MTKPIDMHDRIDEIRARLETGSLNFEHHTALATELHALIIATRLDQLAVAIYETNTPGAEHTEPAPPGAFPPPGTFPPGTPEFNGEVEVLAARLWETDQATTTAAREFADEYSAVQDRYRDQATYLLAPELMEENDR